MANADLKWLLKMRKDSKLTCFKQNFHQILGGMYLGGQQNFGDERPFANQGNYLVVYL